jgi:hypothetical protein
VAESSFSVSFSFCDDDDDDDDDDRSMPSMRSPMIRPIIPFTVLEFFQYVLLAFVGIQ